MTEGLTLFSGAPADFHQPVLGIELPICRWVNLSSRRYAFGAAQENRAGCLG